MKSRWEKMGCVFDPVSYPERPAWMGGFAQAPNAVVYDDVLRIYFCCRQPPDANNMVINRCAYVDLDLEDFSRVIEISEKPCLELGGLGTFDEFGTYPVSVFRDGEEMIAVYGGWTRCESVPFNISLGLAKSSDGGRRFEKVGVGPVLSHSPDEPFVVTSPKLRRYCGKWILTYTAGSKWFKAPDGRAEIIYKLRMAESTDLINWKKVGKNIIPDKIGADEAQACGDIFFDGGMYHMYFCYRAGLDFRENPDNSYRIGYAVSSDLFNWQRDDEVMNLNIAEQGWDSEMVAYPSVFRIGQTTYMVYGGNGNGRTGFGFARLEG